MITESTLYWMTRLDEVKFFISKIGFLLCLLFGMSSAICIAITIVCKVDENKRDLLLFKKISMYVVPFFLLGVLFVISNIFIPTTKQYAMIKVIPAIANAQKIQQEASELYDMAKQALKQTLQIPNLEKPKGIRVEKNIRRTMRVKTQEEGFSSIENESTCRSLELQNATP